jgi:hypothetical protein
MKVDGVKITWVSADESLDQRARAGFVAPCQYGRAVPVEAGILMPVRQIVMPDPWGVHGYVPWGYYTDKIIENEALMTGYIAHIDTPRPDGGINRRYIPAREFYRSPT